MTDPSPLIPLVDFAQLLGGKTPRWVRKHARANNWPHIEIGRAMYFTAETLDVIRARHSKGVNETPAHPEGRITRGRN